MQDRREAAGRGDVDLRAQRRNLGKGAEETNERPVGLVKTNALRFRRRVTSMLGSGESNLLAARTRIIYQRS